MPENSPSQTADSKPFGIRDVALGVLLLLSLLLFYSPAINGGFVFDDDRNITPPDLASLDGLWRIWSEPGASFQYYPVLHSAFWVEHHLWGEAVFGYHLTNLLLHAASACLLVAIMRKLALPGAWFAAFVFALHPVCVESVAWISEQKNTLCTMFYLASALAWLHFDGNRRKRWYAMACVLFLLALLAKTTAATLPAALLVVVWWRRGRIDWKQDALPLLPWLLTGAALDLLSGSIERKGYDVHSSDFSLTLPQHCLLACREIWFYAGKLLWPVNLMFNYPHWEINLGDWWQWLFLLGVLVVAIGLCLLARWNRGPLAAFLFFTGNLVPVMGFFYIGWFMFSYVADHFQYVASLGIIVPLASGLARLAGKIRPVALRWTAGTVAGGMLLVVLSSLTWRESQMYRDMETFCLWTLKTNPANGMAHYNYGLVLLKIPGRLTEAMDEMDEALRLRPQDVKLKDQIGRIYSTTPGRMQDALATWEDSLKLDPNDSYAHFLLGSALTATPGRQQEAVAHLEASVRLKPDEAGTHVALGNALLMTPGRAPDAVAQYQAALRLQPDDVETHYMLGNALLMTPGHAQDAVAEYEQTLQLKPDSAEAHYMLGNALSLIPGRTREAVVHYEEALRLNPDMTQARQRLEQLKSESAVSTGSRP